MDLKKYSNTQILQMLGLRFKDYRLMMNLSQGELAKAAGVSVSTVHKFETGTITNMNGFDDLIPEQPANPYLTAPEHQQQRVRRKNNG